jgi:HPr kinase/phosphorylase
MLIHATCVGREGMGLLLVGPSGAGKSDLALRLIDRGFVLVAVDRVRLTGGMAGSVEGWDGLIEIRGLGIVRLAAAGPVRVVLALDLAAVPERLPARVRHHNFETGLAVPVLAFDPRPASAALAASIAFDCAIGRTPCVRGAFEPL